MGFRANVVRGPFLIAGNQSAAYNWYMFVCNHKKKLWLHWGNIFMIHWSLFQMLPMFHLIWAKSS